MLSFLEQKYRICKLYMQTLMHKKNSLLYIRSYCYRKRYFAIFLFLMFLTTISLYFLFSWGIVCSNVEVWKKVHSVCEDYRAGLATGNLCPPLCDNGRISNMNCKPLHSGKDLVFSAILDGVPLVFKSSKQASDTPVYATDKNNYKHFPSEDEFYTMISNLVATELNISTSHNMMNKLTQLGPVATRSEMRHTEMDNLWLLIQNHEYLAIRLFADLEIFPLLVGSCGELFAVEYAEPLMVTTIWEHEDDQWAERLRNAVLILELLERLESGGDKVEVGGITSLRLCDVRLEHFGKSFDGSKVIILDGDSVVTKFIADALSGDGQICQKHSECHYFDCHASCEGNHCTGPSANNNIQSICEKVFLGTKWGGAMLIPGLLASPHASPALTTLLRLCAFPHGEEGVKHATPDDVRQRLQDTIEEMLNELDSKL